MIKSRLKNITFLIGVLSMFIGGLLFVVMSDLTFKNNSGNLIIAVLLCFGSAIIFFFSNNFIEKPVAMYIMKGLGLALGIGLVAYYHWFNTSEFFINAVDTLKRGGLKTKNEYVGALATMPIAFALTYMALVFQIVNIVFAATLKDDVSKKENGVEQQAIETAEATEETVSEAETVQE